MKKLTDKMKLIITWLGWGIGLITIIWTCFSFYSGFRDDLKVIQKSTLRNTIWNENIPMHDRLESCDNYLSLGYNSETKKFCGKLLERSFDE